MGFSPDVEPVFEATRRWTGVAEALEKRAMAIEEEAMEEIEPLLREGFIRIAIDVNAVCSVPRQPLIGEHAQFFDRHERRPLVQKRLLTLGREQRRLYNELREKIIATSPAPATAQGALDVSKLPLGLRAAATAWAGEKEIAQALKDKLDSEIQVATMAIGRIERENLDLGKTASGWRFDDKLFTVERSCLRSSFHAAAIDQRLEDLLKQREREAERAQEQERLREAAEERRRASEAAAEEQRRAAVTAAEECRRAAEAAAAERRRVDALLVQIDTQYLSFDITAADWKLDPRLSASDRSLLRSTAHVDHVKTRLEQIARERHRVAEETAKLRRVERLLDRFDGEDLAFNLTAPNLGLDARLDPAERMLLGAAEYRDLVRSRLEAVTAERGRRREEAEAEQDRKRQRVLRLLDRIHKDGLLVERGEEGGWKLDLKLTAEERALLRLPVHSHLVDDRLQEIAEEREDVQMDDERRLAEERAQLDQALDRIWRDKVDFDLTAPDWGLARGVSEAERRLLCSDFYRSIVDQCLRQIMAERQQQALDESSAIGPPGTQVEKEPAASEVANSNSPAKDLPPDADSDDNFTSLAEAWRNLGKGIG